MIAAELFEWRSSAADSALIDSPGDGREEFSTHTRSHQAIRNARQSRRHVCGVPCLPLLNADVEPLRGRE